MLAMISRINFDHVAEVTHLKCQSGTYIKGSQKCKSLQTYNQSSYQISLPREMAMLNYFCFKTIRANPVMEYFAHISNGMK